jgi:hypothetical protein
MIPGNPRSAADRARPPLPRRLAPDELHGNGIGLAILLSLLLWGLLILAVIHIIAWVRL